MKNVYLILLLIITAKSWSQGTDVIIWIDNSGSIDNIEFGDMQTSIAQVLESVLDCNPNNRVAVVHYSANGTTPRIYIESPGFTNTAFTFTRRFTESGDAPGALNLISAALNGITGSAANVPSPTKLLNRTPGNALAVYFFTDAGRNGDLASNNTIGSNLAFTAYTNFKLNFGATFIVTIIPPGAVGTAIYTQAINFAAAVASVGGNYTGTVESYPADPDGPGSLPRFLLVKTSFLLTPVEIDIVTDDICSVAEPQCVADLILTLTNNVGPGIHDNRQASNTITASNTIAGTAVGIYHADDSVVLTDGFHSDYSSRFRAYIEGCSDVFVGRPDSTSRSTGNINQNKSSKISPNPATDIVTITSNEGIAGITITSLDGKLMYSNSLSGKEISTEVDIRNYIKGLYMVSITTSGGEIQTTKLIKN